MWSKSGRWDQIPRQFHGCSGSGIQLSHSFPLGSVTITGSHQILTWNTLTHSLYEQIRSCCSQVFSDSSRTKRTIYLFFNFPPPRPSPPRWCNHGSAQGPEKMSEAGVVSAVSGWGALNPPRENAASFVCQRTSRTLAHGFVCQFPGCRERQRQRFRCRIKHVIEG